MSKTLAKNKKAFFDYEIIDQVEAGIVLTGYETKSVRAANISLRDSFIYFKDGEAFLSNASIPLYKYAHIANYDPFRSRKLLLKKREIFKLESKIKQSGYSVVPLSVYIKRNRIKVKIALVKGLKKYEKREKEKKKTIKRQLDKEKHKYML